MQPGGGSGGFWRIQGIVLATSREGGGGVVHDRWGCLGVWGEDGECKVPRRPSGMWLHWILIPASPSWHWCSFSLAIVQPHFILLGNIGILQENTARNINSFNCFQRAVYSHYAEQMLFVNLKYLMFNIFDIFGLFDTWYVWYICLLRCVHSLASWYLHYAEQQLLHDPHTPKPFLSHLPPGIYDFARFTFSSLFSTFCRSKFWKYIGGVALLPKLYSFLCIDFVATLSHLFFKLSHWQFTASQQLIASPPFPRRKNMK